MTAPEPNVLRIKTSTDGHQALTTVLVDETDLLLLHERETGRFLLPADPVNLLPPDSAVLLGGPTPTFAMAGICPCGEPGDTSLWFQVRLVDELVVWEPWPDSPRQTISRTYIFDLLPYLEAVTLGAQTVALWEERPRILARELRRRADSLFGLHLGDRTTITGARAWPGVDEISVEVVGRHGADVFRHPVDPELSDDEVIDAIGEQARRRPRPTPPTADELLTLVLAGPDLPLRGTISTHVERGDRLSGTGWVAWTTSVRPVLDDEPLHVWRDGPLLRVEQPLGSAVLVVGETTAWTVDRGEAEAAPTTGAAASLVAVDLLTRGIASSATDRVAGVRLDPFVRRSTFLDRPTWAATLLRANGLEPVHLEVDSETGLVLSERTDGGTVVEWTELVVGEALDPALFDWDGPAHPRPDPEAAEADVVTLQEQRRSWFSEHVLAGPLRVDVELELTPVRALKEDTGTVTATFGRSVVLLRRPRSEQPWAEGGQHWSTERWDWAVVVAGGAVSADDLRALRAQLPDG